MSNPDTSRDVLHPQTATSHKTTRHDGWTPQRQSTFLRALAASHSVAAAAREAGMSRQSPYALRARLKGEPFDLAWQAALQCRFDVLVEAAMERALHGVEVPHFYRGELVGTSRRYDERLTVALLMMRDKFALPYMPSTHPGFAYSDGEFGKLLDRVEQGPETWAEQQRLAFAGPYDPDEVLDAYDDDYDDYDDYDGNDPDDCANERANAGDDLQGDGIAPDWYVPDGPDA